MAFTAVRLSGCFPELFGFTLLDPARLDRALGGESEGRDLLALFTTTDQGDRVVHDDVALPTGRPTTPGTATSPCHPAGTRWRSGGTVSPTEPTTPPTNSF